MGTSVVDTGTPGGLSAADALWSLIEGQPKSTRRILTERLVADNLELAEHLTLKASIERGWRQAKEMQQHGDGGSLQELIDGLRAQQR